MPPPPTLLHTSDWHLGRAFHGRRPTAVFDRFLDWLPQAIAAHGAEVLLVAGDVFDSATPSPRVQAQYYRLLATLAKQGVCRHVVVVAGNHDSPALLDAPQPLLAALDVHVIGVARADVAEEVLTLHDAQGRPELIVCAVPYLHDRDLRQSAAGESVEDKERQLADGLCAHYAAVARVAEAHRAALGADIPIVATGHLFAAGGTTVEDDGVRSLYVGTLAHIGADAFPAAFDYVALGHLHRAQTVAGQNRIRYSGAPLVLGFGEAGQGKSVNLVRWQDGRTPDVHALPVPCFQPLARLEGDETQLAAALDGLLGQAEPVWLEIRYTGTLPPEALRQHLAACLAGSPHEILRLRHQQLADTALAPAAEGEALETLDPETVFQRLLDAHQVPPEERPDLLHAHRELLRTVLQSQGQANE